MAEQYITVPPETDKMPPGIPYIVGNEAAERFSYYGMRAILVVFLVQYLHLMSDQIFPSMSNAEATARYHTFSTAVYFAPIFGALLSDFLTGKYPLIIWVSVIYCLGHLSLAFIGSPGMSPTAYLYLGLALIAVGSGGIKPCVSAHVGDQFGKSNQHLMSKVYQWFYFSINLGSTVSTILTPWLLKWYGPHVAFGIPGVLMGIATLMFWLGRYKFVHIPPARSELINDLVRRGGWMTLIKISAVFIFASVFWALFDQTSSSWVLQAENMNRNIFGYTILTSQIQVVNPILVMLLIPLFQFVIYPAIDKVFPLSHLRKFSIGLFVTVSAFAVSALIEQWIVSGGYPSILWQVLAYVLITSGEIMVSITGLEFSYAQAPKSMKSIVMAVWLFFIAFGNFVTAYLNHFIQVPSINMVIAESKEFEHEGSEKTIHDIWKTRSEPIPTEAVDVPEGTERVLRVAGEDQEFDTGDDILLFFGEYESYLGIQTSEDASLEAAKEVIDQSFAENGETLPVTEEGQKLISGMTDIHGEQLAYKQLTRNRYQISSAGYDQKFQTPWDVTLDAVVSRATNNPESDQDVPYTWIERRLIELRGEEGREEVEAARGNIQETEISSSITVGGAVTLEGPAYYWFWTGLMLATAVVFVPVAYLYKATEYVEEDEDPNLSSEALEEGSAQ
ncbi:Dipeptide and tripeptide permease A [Thalassoglobus neptunius]|uniref:Dipeptide and tripeptide permease A n=1 Tax=Thalassoglobus neptunius TaxID=1938619 RepID=A0A5C5VJQ2_9PLAN|nr:POT family MFS transporter [Thalassoglobus neptunius]TWT38301.1 Dipeptide and tripeptide permease A [Thalassoglobus neptunius]